MTTRYYGTPNTRSGTIGHKKAPATGQRPGAWRDLHRRPLMSNRICSIEDCDKLARSRGWCPKHYTRWKRHGDPSIVKKPRVNVRPPLERLLSHIDASGDCWEWTGTKSAQGYGTVGPGYPSRNAHRALWILLVGPVPDGWHVDHLCRNTSCVNPDHLEPVTHQENIQRGMRRVRRCTICYLPTHAKGYCESHYRKHLRGTL